MKKLLFLIVPLALIGCHRKPHYHIEGVMESVVGNTPAQDLKLMKENPDYWDCEYNDYGYPGCKMCVDAWASGDFPHPKVIVAPEFCEGLDHE